METGTNTASEPAGQPPRATPAWGRGYLDYARSEGSARRPNTHAEQAAAQGLDLWITRITVGERHALGVSIRRLSQELLRLQDGICTMADVAFGHWAAPHTTPTAMDHPSRWHYVASRLMAHMRTYGADEMNSLHWRPHERAALRVRATMQRHNIWAIPGSPGSPGHAFGHRRPRYQEVPEPSRQMARHDSPRRHQGPPPGVDSPSSTHGSPLRPFAPRWDRGSPHATGMKGGTSALRTPDRREEARNPGRFRRRSRTPPPAARRVVFHEGAVEASTTRLPNRHHLPLMPGAGPRGPAPSRRTSPPFPRRPSERDRQRSTGASTRQQTVHPARPLPPSQQHRQVRHRGDGTQRRHGQGDQQQTSNPDTGWGQGHIKASPPRTGPPTNRSNAQRGSAPWL